MKAISLGTAARLGVLGALLASGLSGCGKFDATKVDAGQARKVLYYQSAMHPWIKSDKPGRCTICGMELTPVYEGETGLDTTGDVVRLSQTTIQVLNVQTAEVKSRPLMKTLLVSGTIDDDDSRHRFLSAYVPGRIESLSVSFVGAEVKQGEALAEFYSPALLQAENEYRALAGPNNADLRSAAASRLRQMGLSAEQIEAVATKSPTNLTSQILAPVSGTVTEKKIYAGQYVQEGEKLFEIADFSTMWFQFRAYEMDLPWLQTGLAVEVSTPSLPGKIFRGSIRFIDPNFDEATRSTKVRVELPNPLVGDHRLLLHRLYAEGNVHLEATQELTVPRSAVIQTGAEAVAYVEQGGGGYARRSLKLGRRGDDYIEVLDGLAAGEKVVVSGNLLIDGQAEMNRSFAAPAEMTPATNAPMTALPALTPMQLTAVKEFLTLADTLTADLSADNLDHFNTHAEPTHEAATQLFTAFAGSDGWPTLVREVEAASHFTKVHDLKAARRAFFPFSTAVVALGQAARREPAFAALKVFRCPMTKDAFPGAPSRGEWIQLQPEIRNPWFGLEMRDCGSEVKP